MAFSAVLERSLERVACSEPLDMKGGCEDVQGSRKSLSLIVETRALHHLLYNVATCADAIASIM